MSATIGCVKTSPARLALPYVASAAIVVVLVAVYRAVLIVNPTTVALTFLVGILVTSANWGLRPAIFMALVATLAFNYFFLPPIGTLTISDPQNWVALTAFLVTAIIASELAERARREAHRAHERSRETEQLYKFSQQLLTSENAAELLNAIPRFIVDGFGVSSAAVSLPNRPDVYRSDSATDILDIHDLQLVCMRGEPKIDPEARVAVVPLRLGVRVVGSLGVAGAPLSRETLEALGSLIAIAVERAGAMEKLSKAEAARESEQLRSALLDSVTHEFRTPLTAIKASRYFLAFQFRPGQLPAPRTADRHQRRKRPHGPPGRRSRRDEPTRRPSGGTALRGASDPGGHRRRYRKVGACLG